MLKKSGINKSVSTLTFIENVLDEIAEEGDKSIKNIISIDRDQSIRFGWWNNLVWIKKRLLTKS